MQTDSSFPYILRLGLRLYTILDRIDDLLSLA